LIVADYRYLLPSAVIASAPFGAVNFHPSLLPTYRGRAPINWAILHGETELGLTAHLIDEGMDTGDVIAQRRYTLNSEEDVGDALRKLYPLYRELTLEITAALTKGHPPCVPQDHALATTFPRRRPEDGLVDFSVSAREVLNLIRAVARPYPGAFAWCDETRITFWKARLAEPSKEVEIPPGTVTQALANGFAVTCGRDALNVLEWEADRPGWTPQPGQHFTAEPAESNQMETNT
jgi:methionyl-tRNA formyltransferase